MKQTTNNKESNTMDTKNKKWETLGDIEREKWCELATDYLIEMVRIPLSDDVWATDKYSEIIDEKAKELWESEQSDRLADLAE